MAKCDMTGKHRLVGNRVSHANNKIKTVQKANVHKRRVFVPEMDQWVTMRLSTRALRTIDKIGVSAFARKQGMDLKDFVR